MQRTAGILGVEVSLGELVSPIPCSNVHIDITHQGGGYGLEQ